MILFDGRKEHAMNTLQLKVIEMTNRKPSDPRSSQQPEWSGLTEIDRAIAEDRLTAYRWTKAWADPWGRKVVVLWALMVAVGFSYLVGAGLHWW
jgi:hypothetical protein